jgi:predicted DNA-binding helix-hairpin-helix protein
MGSVTGMGICHSYAPDGRCISLLKILLTNVCIRLPLLHQPQELQRAARPLHGGRGGAADAGLLPAQLHRGCSSSGIIRSSDYTMEQLVEVARRLREEHDFRGYIHLKTIPMPPPELPAQAAMPTA